LDFDLVLGMAISHKAKFSIAVTTDYADPLFGKLLHFIEKE
jgi:hypothetical protein